MEALIIIGLIVWFIATIPKTNRRYKAQVRREAAEQAANDREDAYFADLIAKADAGDPKAVGQLRFFGYRMREGWKLQ